MSKELHEKSHPETITQKAIEYARFIKKSFAAEFTGQYEVEELPVSVFMAGSPGAGKTESSVRLLEDFQKTSGGQRVMRIDPDEFRKEFISCGYS